ncbi:SMU1112c/YaeR family gloxylase I-like metalloprotein [Sphingobacterium corticibacterium]|uniref:VOC family protein n=1 Tax=Sphingobacterium corticibacterium TaxID=2484746 RepID=A0A4Q6XP52_9SPHI|nr:VOC family protein [Sphingobacterium corticibacterium]RZF61711.1 VOC family protein [Sphingobacterium corticibacterium]
MAVKLNKVHHIAIICSDYARSLSFYRDILGLELQREIYRAERNSYKADLALNNQYIVELFSFSSPPERPSYPEAAGLRHLAFEVLDMDGTIRALEEHEIAYEPIRIDETTEKKFIFIADPDGLPIEFYEK